MGTSPLRIETETYQWSFAYSARACLRIGDVGVGVFPQREEILVGRLGLGRSPDNSEGSAQLQVRQRADRIADHDPAVIENLLELRGGFGALMCRQIGQATHIDRIERADERRSDARRHAQIIRRGGLQQFDAFAGSPSIQCEKRANRRQVNESDCRVLRESPFQIVGECLRAGRFSRESQGEGGAILHIAVL